MSEHISIKALSQGILHSINKGISLHLEKPLFCPEQIYIQDLPKIDPAAFWPCWSMLLHTTAPERSWRTRALENNLSSVQKFLFADLRHSSTQHSGTVQCNSVPSCGSQSNEVMTTAYFQQLCRERKFKPDHFSLQTMAVRDKKLEMRGRRRGLRDLDHLTVFQTHLASWLLIRCFLVYLTQVTLMDRDLIWRIFLFPEFKKTKQVLTLPEWYAVIKEKL